MGKMEDLVEQMKTHMDARFKILETQITNLRAKLEQIENDTKAKLQEFENKCLSAYKLYIKGTDEIMKYKCILITGRYFSVYFPRLPLYLRLLIHINNGSFYRFTV